MRPKLLLAVLTAAFLLGGQAVAYPGAKTSPNSGGQTVHEKSQRTDPGQGNGSQPSHSGDYYYSNPDRTEKVLPDDPTTAVPEPGTLILMGAGLAGAAWMRRRRNKA